MQSSARAAAPRDSRPRRSSVWIARPRVVEEIARACDSDAVVFLFSPPGSGKTLAVDEFARQRGGRVRWLTLRRRPSALADSLKSAESGDLLVADGLDRWDLRTQDALVTALRRLPAGVRTVITSRFAPPAAMACDRLAGRVRVIDPGVLALDRREAVELAEAHGVDAAAAAEMLEDSGGWIAGFILHARARSSAVDRDALDAYVVTEILPALSRPLRFALASTAGLGWVSERLLVELAEDQSVASELMSVPLPGASTRGGLQLAPCIRRLLATTIDGPAARNACTGAAWRLRAAGASADATDALISAGHLVAAEAPAAEAAAQGVEGDRVLEWLRVLDPGAARRRPPLRETELRALHRKGKRASVAHVARAMRASGELNGLLARGEPAAAWAVAALLRGGHAADVLALLDGAEQPIWAPAAWAVAVLCEADPTPPPLDVGAVAMLPLACVVADALLWRGRPADALALLELAERHDPEITLERCRQLLTLGDIEGARVQSTAGDVGSFPPERLAVFECELAVAAGNSDQALCLLPSARAAAERAGDQVVARIDLAIVEGHALWLRGEPRRAIPILDAARSWALRRGLRAAVEWIDVWLAGAMVAGGSARAARPRLERSLADMGRAGRQLGRPLGSLVLAEACWEQGDETGHDKAVDDALRRALQCGGRLMLRAADRLMPDPLARRDRSSADAGLQRRLLDRAIAAANVQPSAEPPVMHVRTLGQAGLALLPSGQPVDGTRRVVELLAYLVARGGAAPIEDVLDDLLPSSTGTGLLKRAVRDAKRVLPAGVGLRLTASSLRIDPLGALVSDDGELMQQAGAATLARGRRAAQLRSAVLALASAGPFLPDTDADWARARREEVTRAVSDCTVAGPTWLGEDANTDDLPEPSHLDLTRRLLARSALGKGVSAEAPPAREAPEGGSRARATP
jgi:hypothetical protein